MLCLLSFLYYYKHLSANSRLLSWLSILEYIQNNPSIIGQGIGSVSSDYMWMQMDFLAKYNIPCLEIIADNNHQAYNEWLRILYEGGVLSLTLFLSFMYFVLNSAISQRDYIIIILIVSMTTMNIFDVPILLCIFIFLLGIIKINPIINQLSYRLRYIVGVLVALISITLFNYTQWISTDEGKLNSFKHSLGYAKQLNCVPNHDNIQKVQYIIHNTSVTYEMLTDIADNYLQLGDTLTAMHYYRCADIMIPNRVLAKRQLLNLYAATNQYDQARIVANDIIHGCIKVKGSIYFEAREQARYYLENIIVP